MANESELHASSIAVSDEQATRELHGLFALFHDVFRGGLAGTIAGIIVLGFGSRVAMRITALLSPDARGQLTDNDNVVGRITFEGTFELVFFVGIFGGLIAGTLWVLVSEWLPKASPARVAAAGIVAVLIASFTVISSANEDFELLAKPGLNVVMFTGLVGLAGSLTAVVDRALQRRLPAGQVAGIVFGVLAGLGAIVGVGTLSQAYFVGDEAGNPNPPGLVGAFLILAGLATLGSWTRYFNQDVTARLYGKLRVAGTMGVLGACLFGAIDLVQELRAIL